MWDVDGTGLQVIGDSTLAAALLEKVNRFNLVTASQAVALTALLALTPRAVGL